MLITKETLLSLYYALKGYMEKHHLNIREMSKEDLIRHNLARSMDAAKSIKKYANSHNLLWRIIFLHYDCMAPVWQTERGVRLSFCNISRSSRWEKFKSVVKKIATAEVKISRKYEKFLKQHKKEPSYASATVMWKDDGKTCDIMFKLSCDYDETEDDQIFFYCNGVDDLISLSKEGMEDFTILADTIEFLDAL